VTNLVETGSVTVTEYLLTHPGMWRDSVCGEDCFPIGKRSMLKEMNHNRRNRRRFLAITAITIAAARFGVTGSARAQSNKTTTADLRAIKVQQMAPAAIRLAII
jgi:hypothetical protein